MGVGGEGEGRWSKQYIEGSGEGCMGGGGKGRWSTQSIGVEGMGVGVGVEEEYTIYRG